MCWKLENGYFINTVNHYRIAYRYTTRGFRWVVMDKKMFSEGYLWLEDFATISQAKKHVEALPK